MLALPQFVSRVTTVTTLLTVVLLSGCKNRQSDGPPPTPVIPVEVHIVKASDFPIQVDLTGRTNPYVISEIRPQVSGIIAKRLFTEGGDVKQGDKLYQIDDEIFRANLQSAQASLARSQANAQALTAQRERFAELIKTKAISQQDYDNINAQATQALADVEAAKAAVNLAQINIRYASITAPISGRIGKSSVTQGALVTANQPNSLATIQTLNPIYVDMTVSVEEMMSIRQLADLGKLTNKTGEIPVSIRLNDNTPINQTGKLLFTDITVDPSTSSVMLRALFDNPNTELLPGMFLHTTLNLGIQNNVLLVPQVAVSRDARGDAFVLTVTPENTVASTPVTTGPMTNDQFVITSGLKEGDQVIVNNLMILRPGASVTTGIPSTTAPTQQ